ncbi:YigZ family protein [Halobaculum sp. MBLA0147]|uniref:IMPACT family protein n=1 Tax=Halobaculum sp. MBLA0147 TaxID=3079934 RepID=UPI003523E861
MESYRTVAERATAEFVVQGSEFLGHVAPAADPAAAEAFVAEVRAEYDDATHNVPAYRVPATTSGSSPDAGGESDGDATGGSGGDAAGGSGADAVGGAGPEADDDAGGGIGRTPTGDGMVREYASDDGEPSGSAGDPALNVLQQRDLRNLVCVVTRYYGGTNLGVGGLARAYSRAVKEAVDAAGVVERVPHERFRVTVGYDDSGDVRSLLESLASDGVDFEATYDERVAFDVRVPVDEAAAVRDRLQSATSGRADVDG